MSDTKDGGPAFPNWEVGPVGPEGCDGTVSVPGMSLRDWFAGQALAGLVANRGTNGMDSNEYSPALLAYRLADAMLAARSKSNA